MTVRITHPDLPKAKPATTSQEAFDKVWKGRGWKTVSDAEALKTELELTNPEPAPAKAKTSGGAS